jgi:predicted glycogen debranching enzyme
MAEWLETDGLGGFAMGTAELVRTRRYHGLLVTATQPPAGRMMLVGGLEVWVESPAGRRALSAHCYADDTYHPDGTTRIASFAAEPWPSWRFDLGDGYAVEHDVTMVHGAPVVVLAWRPSLARAGYTLCVRPLLSGRDFHALHRENPAFRFDGERRGEAMVWRPYHGVPGVIALANGDWEDAPEWYRNFTYAEERERGLDHREDLASPGVFRFDLSRGEAFLVLGADVDAGWRALGLETARIAARRLREAERARRAALGEPLRRAADQYLVQRGVGKTIIAGYPWFGDWGRDTFIALRGLCLATGRLADARDILVEWAGAVSQGMLPNRFPDRGEAPEYNSVDAALWYAVAVDEWLRAAGGLGDPVRGTLLGAVEQIVAGYAAGTRYGIRVDEDGLVAAGEPGVQLTWMDAKVGDRVVTPRIGKPVEIQALWLRALAVAARREPRWLALAERARIAFRARFWDDARGHLVDVVDADHVPGRVDPALRPNQVLALGGLGDALLDPDRTRRALDVVERRLVTPMGLRTLAPGEPGYTAAYRGGPVERDGAYHQGTVWPWLMGPFVEAWLRTRGFTDEARAEARAHFLAPLVAHLDVAGLGHVSEIADAEPPFSPRGCPFQAWSTGELIRALAL